MKNNVVFVINTKVSYVVLWLMKKICLIVNTTAYLKHLIDRRLCLGSSNGDNRQSCKHISRKLHSNFFIDFFLLETLPIFFCIGQQGVFKQKISEIIKGKAVITEFKRNVLLRSSEEFGQFEISPSTNIFSRGLYISFELVVLLMSLFQRSDGYTFVHKRTCILMVSFFKLCFYLSRL